MRKRVTGSRLWSILLVWMALSTTVERAYSVQGEVTLFTEEEATELRIPGDGWDPVPRARSAPLGPVITIHAPDLKRADGEPTLETVSPTNMRVEFQENLAPVDMKSLEVTAKKGIFKKSLTDKLAPFVDGTTIAVDSMEVPSGKFQIEIAVKDMKGQETRQTYRLVVSR